MSKRDDQELLRQWRAHKAVIESGQRPRDPNESAADRLRRVTRARTDFAYFVSEYFPHYAKAKTPPFHLDLANKVLANPHLKGVVEWYRGAAKSVMADVILPLWLMVQEECQLRCMVLVGVNETAAIRLLNDVKAELEANQHLNDDFSIGKKAGDWADKEFTASNGSMFVALGLGQSVRGLRKADARPDFVVIDDIDDLPLSRNPARLTQYVNWIERSVLGIFGVERSRLLIVNNRIAKDQVMSRMVQRKPHWAHFFVPALNRKGTPAWPELHDAQYWAAKRKDVGEAAFSTEYMLVVVVEGTRFMEQWIKWSKARKCNILRAVAYIDPSWRNTKTSDHKAVKLWLKLPDGGKHLYRAFVRKADTDDMVKWCFDTYESLLHKLPVKIEFYIEGIFMQDDFMAEFDREGRDRGYFLPIMPDYRTKPQKGSRIESMIPQYKRGIVSYEETMRTDPDMVVAIDHLITWDVDTEGVPDDSPDADESAWHIIDHVVAFSGEAGQLSFGGATSRTSKYRM